MSTLEERVAALETRDPTPRLQGLDGRVQDLEARGGGDSITFAGLNPEGAGASATVINPNFAPYNALPGIGTPRVGLQAALDAAALQATATEPVTVKPGKGVYACELVAMPGQASPSGKAACLWLDSNVTLDLSAGAVIQLANGQVLPAGCNKGYIVSTKDPWTNATHENVHVIGGAIDANGNNQTLTGEGNPRITTALLFARTRNFSAFGTIVKNLRGTLGGPPGETFHFDALKCSNGDFISCEADGSGAIDTSTGFSSNQSVGIGWIRCRSHDMAHGQGFTHWQSANLEYVACRAWNISQGAEATGSGFNSERSNNVNYVQCSAGADSAHIPAGEANPFYATDNQSLFCHNGFHVIGSTNVVATGCSARNCTGQAIFVGPNKSLTAPTFNANTTNGSPLLTNVTVTNGGLIDILYTVTAAGVPVNTGGVPSTIIGYVNAGGEHFGTTEGGDPSNSLRISNNATATAEAVAMTTALHCHSVQFIGGDVRGSLVSVVVEAGSTDVRIQVKERIKNTGTWTEYGDSPIIQNEFTTGGYRRRGTAGQQVQRWEASDGTVLLNINSKKQVGTTAGRFRKVRTLGSEATTVLPTDDVLVWTALTSTHVATLPKSSEVEVGTEFVLEDGSGGAAAGVKITAAVQEGDTIKGNLSVETAYGRRVATLIEGKAWLVT